MIRMSEKKSLLLEALKSISQEDLDACEAEIERLDKELVALRQARNLMKAKLGLIVDKVAAMHAGRTKKAEERRSEAEKQAALVSSGATAAEAGTILVKQRREAIYNYLAANGPTLAKTLCEKLDIPLGSIGAVLNHQWFKCGKKGIELV